MVQLYKLCKDLSEQNWDFIKNVTDVNKDYKVQNTFSNTLLDKMNLYYCNENKQNSKAIWFMLHDIRGKKQALMLADK